jgi:hypothetical protein
MSDKPVAALAFAPVVSHDSKSPEAKMAADAKKLEVQSHTDSIFDTKLERFCGGQTTLLSGLTLALTLILLSLAFQKRK